ncbi:winged helix-turn-helix domain-containing protein [Flavobacterium sp. 3HN19-14]|uniref:winged helix-turn-helix domain-containing protein n=1 Tax=Flavobacterium sp. 3HN19-14 TaxID=3448133 RepID=UPI003EE28431
MLARIRTALRNTFEQKAEPIVNFEDISVDMAARIVKVKDIIIKLTATEYALLLLLIKNEGRVLTHQYLLKEIWRASLPRPDAIPPGFCRATAKEARSRSKQAAPHPDGIRNRIPLPNGLKLKIKILNH